MVNPDPIFLQNVFTFKNLPVQQNQRKCTDCCCTILTGLFALIMFIISLFMFTKCTNILQHIKQLDNYYQLNFPADDNGITCYNQLHDYPYMYFSNPSDASSNRFCLKKCPIVGQLILCNNDTNTNNKNIKQKPNCKAITSSYQTHPQVNKIGAFCSPSDQTIKNKLFSSYQLGNKLSLTYGYDIVKFALLFGFLIGLIYLTFVGCLHQHITYCIFGLASLILIVSAFYIVFKPVDIFINTIVTIILIIFMILFAIGYIVYFTCNKKQIQLVSILIKHSNNFLKEKFTVYLYIPLFIILTIGFLVLIIWQYIAFGTGKQPYFEKQAIYYHSDHSSFLQFLNIIELIWGLQFLRDAFNFIISGNSIQWYFRSVIDSHHCTRPLTRLIAKHWGSVVGGSFLNAFFKVFDVIGDFFKFDPDTQYGKCQNIYEKVCCCNPIFELMRSDAYSYINLTGIPYCNAVRQCQALCKYSNLINGTYSVMKVYRNAAHIFVIGLASLLCYILFGAKTSNYGEYDHFWIAIAVILAAYSMSTYFIDIHQNAAEAIMITYLTEENCQGQQNLEVCPGDLIKDIFNFRQVYVQNQENFI